MLELIKTLGYTVMHYPPKYHERSFKIEKIETSTNSNGKDDRKYKYYSKCNKCGYYICPSQDYEPPATQYRNQHNKDKDKKEYLLRICARCGYRWIEKCIDDEDNS